MARLISAVLLVATVFGCRGEEEARPAPVAIPADLTYEVLNATRPPALKCSVEVRLSYKVPENIVESLSLELQRRFGEGCGRMFVAFYLREMRPGAGAWATSQFEPELVVTILGLTPLQETTLVAEARADRELVGTWVDDTSYAAVMTLYRNAGPLMLEWRFKDGNAVSEEIRVRRVQGKVRFEERGGSLLGRYWTISDQGHLEVWDAQGFINTARLSHLDQAPERVLEDERARHQRLRKASVRRAEERREVEEGARLAAWTRWVALYRSSLEPLRHRLELLDAAGDPAIRQQHCDAFLEELERVPLTIRAVPTERISLGTLEEGLGRVDAACRQGHKIEQMVEARSTLAEWQTVALAIDGYDQEMELIATP